MVRFLASGEIAPLIRTWTHLSDYVQVANEWNRLGTRRRVNPAFSLIWMAFLLGGAGLRYNATPQPDLADTEVRHVCQVLYYYSGVMLFFGSFFVLLVDRTSRLTGAGHSLEQEKGIRNMEHGIPTSETYLTKTVR